MKLNEKLKSTLVDYLNTGSEHPLKSLIDLHPEVVAINVGDYPDCHRIVDIRIGGKSYRVCRQISADERSTLTEIDKVLEEPGVPIWLEGEMLEKWARSEEDNPSDGPCDWESYR
jgi:hypothetical protein